MRTANLRLISFALILIFTQKLGLGLWLHNWLHEPRVKHSLAVKNNRGPGIEGQPAKCNCIDDALMPLIHSNLFIYLAHQKHLAAVLLTRYSSPASLNDKSSPALRGPPSAEPLS
jgi:hypothetical protein